MAQFVYRITDGTLYSWTPDDDRALVATDDVLAANGLALTSGLAIDPTHAWDPVTKTIIVVIAPVIPRQVQPQDFVLAFTPQEFVAIKSSVDPAVQQFMFATQVSPLIDMNSKVVANGLAYLVSIGLLTADRPAAIISGAGT